MTTDIHTCSYHCDRPACIKRQRDALRDFMNDPPCQSLIKRLATQAGMYLIPTWGPEMRTLLDGVLLDVGGGAYESRSVILEAVEEFFGLPHEGDEHE